ncbi:MAG: B12-binding domain-containing radical SAM protein [Myxococcales bacterium]|nr:MAG: B12-binding domain-containing radical SAM protein [Myxococcales bacterium]
MKIGLFSVFSQKACTLKDVAGGYGTVFRVGHSWRAKLLERAKTRLIHLPPPSLGYLAAFATQGGHQVVVRERRPSAKSRDPMPDVDLAIVLSSITDAPEERKLLAELKDKGIHSIVVGAFASAKPEYYSDIADAVICGEAEALGHQLFDKNRTGVIEAGEVKELSKLPLPDWSMFPRKHYRYAGLAAKGQVLPVLGMRGCAFRCNYCPYPVTASYRLRPVSDVVDEVRFLKKHYGVRGIAFRDPLFNASRQRLAAFIEQLKGLQIHYSAEMRADRLDIETLDKLYDSGLRSLQIGIESADASFATSLNRDVPDLTQIKKLVHHAEKIGIRVIANYILGLPNDTEARMKQSIDFAKKLNSFAVQFTVATPYPKTQLAAAVKDKVHAKPGPAFSGWEPTFVHPQIETHTLKTMREKAYISYHFRVAYLLHFVSFLTRPFQKKLRALFSIKALNSKTQCKLTLSKSE